MPISGIQIQPGFEHAGKAGGISGAGEVPSARDVMLRKMLEASGDTGNSEDQQRFQIGGKAYTQDEWDRMLRKVDRVIDEIRTENQEEAKEREAILEAKGSGAYEESEITEAQIAELFRDRG